MDEYVYDYTVKFCVKVYKNQKERMDEYIEVCIGCTQNGIFFVVFASCSSHVCDFRL